MAQNGHATVAPGRRMAPIARTTTHRPPPSPSLRARDRPTARTSRLMGDPRVRTTRAPSTFGGARSPHSGWSPTSTRMQTCNCPSRGVGRVSYRIVSYNPSRQDNTTRGTCGTWCPSLHERSPNSERGVADTFFAAQPAFRAPGNNKGKVSSRTVACPSFVSFRL